MPSPTKYSPTPQTGVVGCGAGFAVAVGAKDESGSIVGVGAGFRLGTAVGRGDGTLVGTDVGSGVGIAVGTGFETSVDREVGLGVGASEGSAVGTREGVGDVDSSVGSAPREMSGWLNNSTIISCKHFALFR